MAEQTYDPILGSEEPPKWRLTSPLRPPTSGRALVLVRDSGPSLTVRSGEEVPSSRYGTYRAVFTVDMTEHRLILDIPLLSRDPTFSFRCRVDLVCRVADPAQVVARGIHDMSGALYRYLRRTLQSVARDYDIAEFHDAERALDAALSGFGGDDAVRLRNVQVELLVDEDEIATSGREFRDVVRETRLEGMRRRRHLDMIREEGVDGLIAGIMEKEGPRAALAWIEKGEAEKREVRREVMRMVLERGDADREPFEQAELERAVLDEVLRDGDGLFETATRRGRLGGSLARDRALEPAPPRDEEDDRGGRAPLKGEVVGGRGDTGRRPAEDEHEAEAGAGTRAEAERRREPVRPRTGSTPSSSGGGYGGSAGRVRHDGPPEDEPLPDGETGGGASARTRRLAGDGADGSVRPERPWRRGGGDTPAAGAGLTDEHTGDRRGGPAAERRYDEGDAARADRRYDAGRYDDRGDDDGRYGGHAHDGRGDGGGTGAGIGSCPRPTASRSADGKDADEAATGGGGAASERPADDSGPRVSRVRGTATRPRPGGGGTEDGKRR
ncbi:hypothetical protein [Streptomyces sp. NPDC058461]|uniref:hypothetical protein n=1 Tax=Streptomyces sp. NPDC058461 TaxID=3346509 RepID=UPI0036657AB6